jgi:catechol 2,3-dioxygenase-like lactoylglutathione lyase family enzyme
MQLKFASVMVGNQDEALRFYTEKLGFAVKDDLKMGAFRWLTVTSPVAGAELILEATEFPPSAVYQKARYEAGIPAIVIVTNDVRAEHQRLLRKGVKFRGEPVDMGFITSVSFEDGCGNLVNLVQQAK